jgi:Domain of unknown function (DU1801)
VSTRRPKPSSTRERVIPSSSTMSNDSADAQIARFLAEYTPGIEAQLREARRLLRSSFARGFELVFNNYNALVFGISPSERSNEAFVSVAGYPRWVTLFFLHGAGLQDPAGLLEGNGNQVRGIRLASAATIGTPEVQALVAQAVRPHASRLLTAPPLSTILKQMAAERRPRRPVLAVERSAARAVRGHDA